MNIQCIAWFFRRPDVTVSGEDITIVSLRFLCMHCSVLVVSLCVCVSQSGMRAMLQLTEFSLLPLLAYQYLHLNVLKVESKSVAEYPGNGSQNAPSPSKYSRNTKFPQPLGGRACLWPWRLSHTTATLDSCKIIMCYCQLMRFMVARYFIHYCASLVSWIAT